MKQFLHDILEDWPMYLAVTLLGALIGFILIARPRIEKASPPVNITNVVYVLKTVFVTNTEIKRITVDYTNNIPSNLWCEPMSSADIQVLKDIAPEAIDWDSLTPQQKLDTN